MNYFQQNAEERERERRRRLWDPAPHKLSWTEMCKRLIDADPSYAKEIGHGSPPFMSNQILKLKLGKNGSSYSYENSETKEILHTLRPEDAIHTPQLRFDCNSGEIMEWNRSLGDLTGISAAQVVGKPYAEVLDEWLPNLTKEYKEAAVEWVKKKDDESNYDAEGCREDYLFPLPLPIKYDSSFKYVSENRHYNEYIEILVARADRLFELYPNIKSIPQCQWDQEARKDKWNFDTSGWVGGVEFTLRRKQYIPSLQTLCRELLSNGDHALNEDGSLAVPKPAENSGDDAPPKTPEEEVYTTISNFVRSCGPIGIKYIREVMNAVCKRVRNWGIRTKCFHFSTDWSSNPETSTIHKSVMHALGGAELITEKIEKGKMVWTLNFSERGGGSGEGLTKSQLNRLKQDQGSKVDTAWGRFKTWITPVIAENKNFPITCGASDSTFVLPAASRPERTLLTLKIEGHERSDGSYGEEKFKAYATVQVPASLNLFQLHRVVCQTMNCGAYGRRETHEWKVPNINSDFEKPITDDNVEYVQIGETYFVENGKREDYGFGDEGIFDTGGGVRQRVSRTGAFVDQDMPFYFSSLDDKYTLERRLRSNNFGHMKACIHSTSVNSVFFQPGAMALLQNGLGKYFTTYKITCMKSEEYAGPLPLDPDINVMLPKCLRGKPEEDDEYWSVEKANKQLHSDRGCLRRNLYEIGSNDFLVQMPFCNLHSYPINKHWSEDNRRENGMVIRTPTPFPVAVHLTGLDHYPMFLHGEPPLPSSDDYENHVSSLRGRIDPDFLQDNIMGMSGEFAVPFRYGKYSYSYDSDASNCNGASQDSIGKVWTREVDDETKRIESLQPKKTAKGKKRKAPSKASAS
mmetsp:Transcript_16880/g.28584  ORF Transcript_16880/g.28584 Transcript_16880/m.28584 type:complete len:859 (+) Transcript_16880:49-2625(+)